MIISKDKTLNKWVVWLKKGNAYFMQYADKTKKKCKEYVNGKQR